MIVAKKPKAKKAAKNASGNYPPPHKDLKHKATVVHHVAVLCVGVALVGPPGGKRRTSKSAAPKQSGAKGRNNNNTSDPEEEEDDARAAAARSRNKKRDTHQRREINNLMTDD